MAGASGRHLSQHLHSQPRRIRDTCWHDSCFSLCLASLLGPAADLTAVQQKTYVVDGTTGNSSGIPAYATISQAAAVAQAGDTILVVGMTWNGKPAGYSDASQPHPGNPDSKPEGFPIPVPGGVTIQATGSKPVYVWSTQATGVSGLFKFEATSTTPLTRQLKKIVLVGAPEGIEVVASGDKKVDALVRGVYFAWNGTALDAAADLGGRVVLSLKSCTVTDQTITVDSGVTPPAYRTPQYGFYLDAQQTNQALEPGQVDITVDNLALDGAFTTMPSALFHITAGGQRAEHLDVPPFQVPISQVVLSLNGSTLDGWATDSPTSAGWHEAVHFELQRGTGAAIHDYSAGIRVELTGTTLKRFRDYSIYGLGINDTRGEVVLNGGTVIEQTGYQYGSNQPPAGDPADGIYLKPQESYLSLVATSAVIRKNARDGISLDVAGGDFSSEMTQPTGCRLGLDQVDIYQNGRDGIRMQSSSGVVGGTWIWHAGDRHFYRNFPGVTVPQGQGVVDRCTINNNGEHGVYLGLADAYQNSSNFASVRFTNTFVWNNGKEGYHAETGEYTTLLAPVVQCTFVGNGDPAAGGVFNIEVSGAGAGRKFHWLEYGPAPNNDEIHLFTKLWNSIFQGKDPTDPDFGPGLAALATLDPGSLGPWVDTELYVRGLRSKDSYGESVNAWYTDFEAPFVGPSNYGSVDPLQFLLDPVAANYLAFDKTPNYLSPLEAPESAHDYLGAVRPDPSTEERDKGAHQAD